MTEPEILKQEEIDALLGGVDSGEIVTGEALSATDEPRRYDLGSEVPAPGRIPKLEMVNERFARFFRVSLGSLLRSSVQVTAAPLSIIRFGEFLRTLPMPTSINMVSVEPLRGTAAVVFVSSLVSVVVDRFFGGSGRSAKIESRDFTAAESRVVEVIRASVFADLKEAWSVVASINFKQLATETNPQFVNQLSLSETVVVVTFRVEVEESGGELQLIMPYAMIEPLHEQFDTGVRRDGEQADQRWYHSLREELQHAKVDLRTVLGRTDMTLGRLLGLKPGDVLPFDFTGQATVYAEDIAIFRGGFGGSRGIEAVKVESSP